MVLLGGGAFGGCLGHEDGAIENGTHKKKKKNGTRARKPLDFPFHPEKRQDEGCHQHMIMLMP